tara:strand:- start:30 stop:476 length:447 start_codon:yes stop_codon:yes gene_type:complete
MTYKFSTGVFIEESFFNEMAIQLGGVKKKGTFNGKDVYQNCRCPSCGKKKAVMGYMRSADTFMLACPVESHICSLNGLTLHDLIKEHGGKDMFDRWRKARWTHVPDWLPIKNRRQEEKRSPQKKTFKDQLDLKSQTFEITVRGEGEEG